jgi:DinB family
MNSREHFAKLFADEKPRFVRVLKAVPADRASYRPHEKSTTASGLVWLLASELSDACKVVDHGEVNFVMPPEPSVTEAVAAYEVNANELEKRLGKLDDAAWGKTARFKVDGNVAWEAPLGDMLWGFLLDAVHHRGQLSTYLRPMGAKVPSIYGPSADDPGM